MRTPRKGILFLITAIIFLFISNLIISKDTKEKQKDEEKKLSQPLEGKKLREAELEQKVLSKIDLLDTEEINLIEVEGAFKIVKPEGPVAVKNININNKVIKFNIENQSKRKLSFVLDKDNAESDDHILVLILNPNEKVTHKVNLNYGVYHFYCPINPTPQYRLNIMQPPPPRITPKP